MRGPFRSESDAFRFTLGGAGTVAVSVLVGWLADPWVGLGVFSLAVVVSATRYLSVARRDRPAVLQEAATETLSPKSARRRRHVLVVANQPLAGSDLRARILEQDDGHVLVDVLAPVLTSRIHYAMSDIDREFADARDRLARSLAWAREQGIAVRGTLGDPSPTTAIEDELRRFGADEVIVATHPSTSQTCQERGELERLQRELDMPVTHVVVGDDGADEPAR
jgi:uncharacterized membrane protein